MKQFFKLSFLLLAILLPASANAKANGIDYGYYFYMNDINTYGDTTVFFPIYLYNEGLVKGFVFDIFLPDDLQLIGINKANHLVANTEVVWVDKNNYYSVGVANGITNVVADPGNDIVLYLEIKIPDDAMGYYPIVMDNIQIVPEYDSLLSSYSSYTAHIFAPYSSASTIVNSIELNQTDAELIEGETLQLKATVLPDNATDKSVTWVSGNPSVATVGSTGLVTALASGTATITATTNDGSNLIASCVVTVTQSESSIINFADANVKAICVQNWDTNGDGELSKAEAAAVTSLRSIFANNKTITSFNELQYFTGLNSIPQYDFEECSALTSIIIPNSVTSIGRFAFCFCSSLRNVNIPNSVISIGESPFIYCKSLSNVTVASGNSFYDSRENCNAIIETANNTLIAGCMNTIIPNSVTTIGNYAFQGCSDMTSLNIPSRVTSIGKGAFYECSRLTSVTIPNSVTTIGNNAFYECNRLTNVTIPNSVTTIGDYAFFYCSNLTNVKIPNSVVSIGSSAFGGCKNLTRITVESENTHYDSRNNCNAIIETASNSLIAGCINTVIPNSVITIGNHAFYECNRLTNVTIPNSVTTIGNSTFSGCIGLTNIEIPSSVIIIGSAAFSGCSGMTNLTIPNSVTSIGDNAFSSCYGLFSVNIPNSVTTIGEYAFSNCRGLTDIYSYITTLSNVTVGLSVFNLYPENYSVRTLHVPVGTAGIYQSDGNWYPYFGQIVEIETNPQDSIITFADPNVKTICVQNWDTNRDGELSEAEAAAVTSLNGVFYNNTIITSFEELQYFIGLTSIDEQEFCSCTNLASITIPNTVTSIGNTAFAACFLLTSVAIPCSVTTLGNGAFADCRMLTSISFPDSLKTIGNAAFEGCSGLTCVTIPFSVAYIGNNPFNDCNGLTTVTVEIGNQKYDSRNNCNAIIETASNTLIAGCKNTIIPNSINTIGNRAFGCCNGLTSITIPNSVTSIENYAFYYCQNLTSISFPNAITSIGESAFSDCYKLTSITIPKSVSVIGSEAFSGCISLKSINVDVSNIKYDSRDDCNAIIETASNSLIAGCMNTVISNSVISIGNYGFRGCSGLTYITIPNSVTNIGDYAFYGCSGLTSLTIPNSVTAISDHAFFGCSSLTSVYSFITDLSTVTTGNDVFYLYLSDYSNRILHVPYGTASIYQCNEKWYPYFGSIVEMAPVPATEIELNQSAAELTVGDMLQLTATLQPQNTDSESVIWSTSKPNVATVDDNGLVTARSLGSATISAMTTDGSNLSASCVVTVTEDLSDYDNYLSLPDTTVMHGDTIIIPVKMTNEASIISFQTDIYLPEGLELLQEDGEYIIEPSERMTRTHSIISNDISNGSIRVVCYSSNYKPFTGQSGDDLFYITVKVADDAEGDYTIQLKNTLFTTSDFNELSAPEVAANVHINAYILGDANSSGTVTVTDVVTTAKYVLEMNPLPFVFEAADVNFDSTITVTDVSRIAWMVLNPSLRAPLRTPAICNNSDNMSGNGISIAASETRTVSIMLDNEMDYSAFQLDLRLPAGLAANNFQLTNRAGSHAFDVNKLQNSKTRVLCYSPALTAIDGHDGTLLTFDVTATGNIDCDITVDDIELITTACQTVHLDAFTISVNNMTSVNELANGKAIAKVEYFNLAGQRIEQPESGVTLIVTFYTDGTRSTKKIFR